MNFCGFGEFVIVTPSLPVYRHIELYILCLMWCVCLFTFCNSFHYCELSQCLWSWKSKLAMSTNSSYTPGSVAKLLGASKAAPAGKETKLQALFSQPPVQSSCWKPQKTVELLELHAHLRNILYSDLVTNFSFVAETLWFCIFVLSLLLTLTCDEYTCVLPLVDVSLGWISHSIDISLYKCCIYKIDTRLILADCNSQRQHYYCAVQTFVDFLSSNFSSS